MRIGIAILAALALTGCAGAPAGPQDTSEQAVSQQSPTTNARQRAKIHTELGSLYFQDGRFGIAQEEGRVALAADSGYAPAYNLLGLVHMSLQENAAAEEAFREALRLAPNDPEINNNFGWFLCQTDRMKQASAHFMAAIRNPLYTTPSKPLTNLGLCHLKDKNDRLAEDFLGKALQADGGNNAQALYWLSDIYYRSGRYDMARRTLADLHKVKEPNAQSAWLALRVERRIGDREGEARYVTQLRRKFQGSPEYQKLMQGQYE